MKAQCIKLLDSMGRPVERSAWVKVAWSRAFWERFFDGEPEAVAAFEDQRAKIVAADS